MKLRLPILSIIFIICSVSLIAQENKWTLTGTVVDKANYSPIPNVNIYISNTTIGTTSDVEGNFRITGIPFETISVVFSCIGFEPETREVVFSNNKTVELKIKMDQTTYDLPQIDVVETKNEKWQNNFKVFKQQFLGDESISEGSFIENPYRINFTESDDGALSASCKEPIVIKNNYLGYKLVLNLKQFVYKHPAIKFYGTTFFEENLSEDSSEAQVQLKNRLNGYTGSLRHFLKTICKTYLTGYYYSNTSDSSTNHDSLLNCNIERLRKQGFAVSTPLTMPGMKTTYPANTDLLLSKGFSHNEIALRFEDVLQVNYDSRMIDPGYDLDYKVEQTRLTLEFGIAYIDLTSWSVQEQTIKTYGAWAYKRVLNMLPLDYKPEPVPGAVNEIF